MTDRDFTPQEKQKLAVASGIAGSFFPYLNGIFGKLDIRFDDRVGTAGVTASGKLLLNRGFFDQLAPGLETAFVLAHELLHLAQMIFERGESFEDHESLNIAHDILINELICDTMGFPEPPQDGLSWKWFTEHFIDEDGCDWENCLHPIPGIPTPPAKASCYSLEEMVRIIVSVKGTRNHPGSESWACDASDGIATNSAGEIYSNNPFADLDIFGGGSGKTDRKIKRIGLDLIPEDVEDSLFPDEDREAREKARAAIREACRDAAVRNIILTSCGEKSDGRGSASGNCTAEIELVRSFYAPPWQMAMQRWFDGVAVSKRSYARASRRGAWRRDVILPGRDQERRTLHIVLDTSGSMTDAIPGLLGLIGAFARNVGMEQVHILQCDTCVTADEFVDIDRLERYQVSGYGGSDMSPAMLKLAEDPDVTNVLVITDGYIEYPPEKDIPYDVLWCLPEGVAASVDRLAYGKVVCVPVSGTGE